MAEETDEADYYSAGSMKDLDYKRFHFLLDARGKAAIQAGSTFDYNSINMWRAILQEIYNNWRPFINKPMQTEFDAKFKDAFDQAITIIKLSSSRKPNYIVIAEKSRVFYDKMNGIDRELLGIKKKLRLGMGGKIIE